MKKHSVAILADIHGNASALRAVLNDLRRHYIDEIIFAGDLVMNGPRPQETLQCILTLNARHVIGNTDIEVLQENDPVAQWTRHLLSTDNIQFLQSLPLQQIVTPSPHSRPSSNLLIFHASPRSSFDLLILEPHPLGTTFTRATPLEEAQQMLQGYIANLMVFGHIHYYSQGHINNQRIMSISSVGFPFDGNPQAAYAIAIWDGITWSLQQHRVSYNYEEVAQELESSTIPFASRYARMIREANWFPRP